MHEVRRHSLVKPTLETPLHIDFEWWKQNDGNWRVYLWGYLCADHQKIFASMNQNTDIDFVDMDTGIVRTVDGLQNILMAHCARQPGFITENTALVDAVFRVFLANGNRPLSSIELEQEIRRPATTILRTMAGARIYKGVRPFFESY